MALVDADGGTDVLAVKTDCHAACQLPTTRPAGARHSRNSRRSSRRVTTCAVCPFLRLLMAAFWHGEGQQWVVYGRRLRSQLHGSCTSISGRSVESLELLQSTRT